MICLWLIIAFLVIPCCVGALIHAGQGRDSRSLATTRRRLIRRYCEKGLPCR